MSYRDFSINGLDNLWAFQTSSDIRCMVRLVDRKLKLIEIDCAVDNITWKKKAKSCSRSKHLGVMAQNYNDLISAVSCSNDPMVVAPPHPPGWSDGFRTLKRGQKVDFFGYVCAVAGSGSDQRVKCTYKKAHSIDFTIGHKVIKVKAIY